MHRVPLRSADLICLPRRFGLAAVSHMDTHTRRKLYADGAWELPLWLKRGGQLTQTYIISQAREQG